MYKRQLKYGTANDSTTLNFDPLVGFKFELGDALAASGQGTGIFDIPITLPTATGEFEVAFNAASMPDRIQILFDPAGISNNIDDMEVVADSLHVGDHLRTAGTGASSRGEFRTNPAGGYTAAIGTHTDIPKYMYVGTGGDATGTDEPGAAWNKNGTTTLTIIDADIAGPASNTPDSSNAAWRDVCDPDGDGETTSHDAQVGVQGYYYANAAAFTANTKTHHDASDSAAYLFEDDGNVTLKYNKGTDTSRKIYIRIESFSNHSAGTTGWDVYGTRFTAA
mgnify:FL=1